MANNEHKIISVVNAIAYEIRFDIKSELKAETDFVRLFKDESHSDHWGSAYMTGHAATTNGSFPGVGTNQMYPLTIHASSFILYESVTLDEENLVWGYKMLIKPLFDTSAVTATPIISETAHPYTSGSKVNTIITSPGAYGYYVQFDSQSETESSKYSYAYLNIYKDNNKNSFWGSPYYCGLANTDAWNPKGKLIIYNSSFVINFLSYSSSGYYGYKMYITPIYTSPLPQTTELQIDSAHNYLYNFEYTSTISVPNALGYSIRFDNRSATESSKYYFAYLNLYKDSTESTYWGSPYYCGLASTDAWNPTGTLIIYNTSFVLHFLSYSAYSDYGFKMYITPIYTSPLPQTTELQIDSAHNYIYDIGYYKDCSPRGTWLQSSI